MLAAIVWLYSAAHKKYDFSLHHTVKKLSICKQNREKVS